MMAVIQEEETGCAIASSAAIAGISYEEARKIANGMGICAEDSGLYSSQNYFRKNPKIILPEYNCNQDLVF